MKKIFTILILLLTTEVAWSSPEGSWPEESRGQYLPTAKWILVIPAKRQADGSVLLWNKEDAWAKSWIVPKLTPDGVRTVAISGDSEDKRLFQGWQLDNMDVSALRSLASKYRAPAVAVAITNMEGKAAVAAWMPNHEATWDNADGTDPHDSVLIAMDAIFSGRENPASPQSVETSDQYDVSITGQRVGDGFPEYRVEANHSIIVDVLRGVSGIEIVDVSGNERPSVIVKVTDGRDIETILRSSGLIVR